MLCKMSDQMKKRVVVTGIGLITPLGCDVDSTWTALLAGQSGVDAIDAEMAEGLSTTIAARVKGFDVNDILNPKEARKLDTFIHYAIAAADQAVKDAAITIDESNRSRIGVAVGSGIGGLPMIAQNHAKLVDRGPKRVSPFFIPGSIINMACGYISIRHNMAGPNFAAVTACTTGTHNIALAVRLIQSGDADAMLAGGCEMTTTPLGIAGFSAARTLSKQNDAPQKASRPWDLNRDGFVLGEGAGTLMLESEEHAKARGAQIYAYVSGVGMSGDAYHITSPGGNGAYNAMKAALDDAQLPPTAIDYVNAHATSTQLGDVVEAEAIASLFKSNLGNMCVSSTKSMTGHLIGAAGAVEAIIALLAMRNSIAPPTINLDTIDPACDLGIDFVPNSPKEKEMKHVLSNSFGFGGTNASLILSKEV